MKFLTCLFLVLFCLSSCKSVQHYDTPVNNTDKISTSSNPPKLVVGIVVDQMRYDFLTRFASRYSENGFKKLLINGFNCKNNHFNYKPTYTAPGHASVYTGTSPKNHGIISNNWYDKSEKKYVYNAQDMSVLSMGTDTDAGKMSPRRMLSSTITDELELFTQGRAKVIGVSVKDRGAILPAGHAADAAYWFHGKDEGLFISSTYYMTALPNWVENYNNSGKIASFLKPWNTLYPIETYTASGPDLNEFEGIPKGKESATFPYDLKTLSKDNGGFDIIKSTPYGNTIVTDLALEALKNEEMGMDSITDFLAISYSSTDYIGHQFGVNSVEIEDTYLRLDMEIERILDALELQVGQGNFTVFLTSDHGAVHVPNYLKSRKVPAGYFKKDAFLNVVNKALEDKYMVKGLIENFSNEQVFLDYGIIKANDLIQSEIESFLAQELHSYPFIDKVFTRTSLEMSSFTSGTGFYIQNGFHQKRSGDVCITLDPAFIQYSQTGSTHGSVYNYDTHVPLIFYGKGINTGETLERTGIIDIAPTISSLLGIAFPNATTGNPIPEVLEK